jgi:hypothetical protein
VRGARRRAGRWREHGLLVGFYIVLAVAAVAVAAAGSLSSTLGTYAAAVEGNPFPAASCPSLAEHLAVVRALDRILPFVVGGAWLVGAIGRPATRHAAHSRRSAR